MLSGREGGEGAESKTASTREKHMGKRKTKIKLHRATERIIEETWYHKKEEGGGIRGVCRRTLGAFFQPEESRERWALRVKRKCLTSRKKKGGHKEIRGQAGK